MRLPFIFRNTAQDQLQDFLSTHADALISGSADVDRLFEEFDQSVQREAEGLMALAEQIGRLLLPVAPSEQFVNRLYQELTANTTPERLSLWGRIRSLPPRTQLAAGLGGAAMTAGVVYIATRTMPNPLVYWRNRHVA
jgi:hypothetical protein